MQQSPYLFRESLLSDACRRQPSLETVVAAGEASGAEIRVRAAVFPARKTLETFNFDH